MPKQPRHGPKKSAFSCDPCRRRKVKCGGEQPQCNRCRSRGTECEYKLGPTLSYTERLESRVRELQELLQQATSNLDAGERPVSNGSDPGDVLGIWESQLTVDGEGRVSLHGATSIFSTPFIAADRDTKLTTMHARAIDDTHAEIRREQLVTNAWVQRAAEAISSNDGPFSSLLQYLLDFHWTWIQPIFNFVYRPAFTRDMQQLGPYYSHTLLSAILAHSIRWCRDIPEVAEALSPYDNGFLFSYHARLLLHDDLKNGRCDIPTVQTLLLVSAQECGKGNTTQAWVYSGIAFRMIEDLGITIDARKYAGAVELSDEDIEIRNRLFWSCYIWDKVISLYLGRCPVMNSSDISPPQLMSDDSTEYDAWIPHGLDVEMQSVYGSIQSHAVSTFIWTCKLMEIVHPLLTEVYNPTKHQTRLEIAARLLTQKRTLEGWWNQIPGFLKISDTSLAEQSLPNHIVTLNCLYYTTNILVHRPLLSQPGFPHGTVPDTGAMSICFSSASQICLILALFCRSFGSNRCTMALAYSLYTAASTLLFQLESQMPIDDEGRRSLTYCLRTLANIAHIHTVLQKPLQLLRDQLDQHRIRFGIDLSESVEATFMQMPTG